MRAHRQPRIRAGCAPVRPGCEYDDVSAQRPDPIRWGLVGYGSGGRIFHAPLIAAAAGIELCAVVTTDPERRAAVARDHPGAVCVSSLAGLPALGVTAVTISTPPATHVPLALAAIDLGLHVVVDKPFALTAAEAAAAEAAAQAAGVLLVPYQNRRWDGDFLTVMALTRAGRLGAVHHFESRLDRCRPVKPGWASDVSAGGGLLLDLGPHLVDQALHLLGPVHTVHACLNTVRGGAAAEDLVIIDLAHDGGAHSTLVASLAAPAPGPRFLVQGSRAGLRIEGFDGQEARLKAGLSPVTPGISWGADDERCARLFDADGGAMDLPLERGRWDTFYPAVASAITDGTPPPVPTSDAVATARVIDAARASARTGRDVLLGEGSSSG